MAILRPGRTARRLWFLLLTGAVATQAGVDVGLDEYQVKAAFLFNFAKFVEWPPHGGAGSSGEIVMCVYGQNPFGTALDNMAGKPIGDKTFRVHEVSNAQQASKCDILFVSGAERKRTRALLDEVKASSVLTVGETDDFIANGGIVAFKLRDARIRFEIDPAAAGRAKLRISSKLLSLSESEKK